MAVSKKKVGKRTLECRQIPKGSIDQRASRKKKRATNATGDKSSGKRIGLLSQKKGNLTHHDSSDDDNDEPNRDMDDEEEEDDEEVIVDNGEEPGDMTVEGSDEEESVDPDVDDEIDVLDSTDIPTGRGANKGRVDSAGLNSFVADTGTDRDRLHDVEVQQCKYGPISSADRNYLTIDEKVKKWNDGNVSKVIRDNLYPLAKIIFDSDEELQYNGDICKVIMKHVKFEPRYKRMTDAQKEAHRKDMWAVWSGQVSRGLDSKRHNQKAAMRRVFWDWFDDCHDKRTDFPRCEYLLRDNWFLSDPLPVDIMHAGVAREQERIDPELLIGHTIINNDYVSLMLKMGKTVVGAEAWKVRGDVHKGDFEKMILITDEVLIAWTLDGHYNGWCDQYKNRYMKRDGKPKGRIVAGEDNDSSPAETDGDDTTNLMEACKQASSNDETDWLNFKRPGHGSWFIKKSMDAGYTKRNGGTTDLGKERWNDWGCKIAARRATKSSEDANVREKYIAFVGAFRSAWQELYGNDRRRHGNVGGSGVHDKKVTAFNGISFEL